MYRFYNCRYQCVYRQCARIAVRWRNQSFRDSKPVLLFGVCVDSPPLPFLSLYFSFSFSARLLIWEKRLKSLAIVRGLQSVFSLSLACSLCFFLFTSSLYRRGLVWAGHHFRKCFLVSFEVLQHCAGRKRCPWPHLMTLFSQLKLASLFILLHARILYSRSVFCNLPFIFLTLIRPFFLFWGLVSASHFTNETHTSKWTI